MAERVPRGRTTKLLLNIATGLVFLVIVILLLIWLAGGFHAKIDPSHVRAGATSESSGRRVTGERTAPVRRIEVPRIETAVGTVRAVHETSVASKLLAKVIEVNVVAGQKVQKGDVLMRLDNADLTARVEQAEAEADAARAARDQAQIEFDRIKGLFDKSAASKIELDRVQTALRSAEADLERAGQAIAEARTILGYATIAAPLDGVVVDKRVEVGDTATPGQVLLTLYDPTRMQLVASVRESLTHRLKVGESIGVRIDTMGHACKGQISEIVPEAESASRSFSVKVTGPCPPGVYSGMFGRLLIPLDTEEVLVIPQEAVRHVGQLELVDVVEDERIHRRAVKLGRVFDGDVEVLSGLGEAEQVVVSSEPQRED